MAFMPEVKCGRCDRRYSALRARCPYCGTYKRRRTRKMAESDNTTWKMIVGAALMLVLAIGVVTLMVDAKKTQDAIDKQTALENQQDVDAGLESSIDSIIKEADEIQAEKDAQAQAEAEANQSEGGEEGDTTGEGEVDPNAGVTVDIPIESIKLLNARGQELSLYVGNDDEITYDISVPLGHSYELSYSVVPESKMVEVAGKAVWASSDTSKLVVLQSGKITGMGKGAVRLTVTIEGVTVTCIVRVS